MTDLEALRAAFDSLPLSVQLLAGMFALAVLDLAASVYEHVRAGTFQLALLGKWSEAKVLSIIGVAFSFVVAAATSFLEVTVGDAQLDGFYASGVLAATTFILSQASSIKQHLTPKPSEDPVPDEGLGG